MICPNCGKEHNDLPIIVCGSLCSSCQGVGANQSAHNMFGGGEYYQADMNGNVGKFGTKPSNE